MDMVISARVDERVARQIGDLAGRLRSSRKRVIERAIALLVESVERESGDDVLMRTSGAWKRVESPVQTVARARKAFRDGMTRRHT